MPRADFQPSRRRSNTSRYGQPRFPLLPGVAWIPRISWIPGIADIAQVAQMPIYDLIVVELSYVRAAESVNVRSAELGHGLALQSVDESTSNEADGLARRCVDVVGHSPDSMSGH